LTSKTASVISETTQKVQTSDIIFKQRAAKKAKISEEMSLVADKYSENDPVRYQNLFSPMIQKQEIHLPTLYIFQKYLQC
jgi:hypothetical protein